MQTEDEIQKAGPLSADDPQVQAALRKMSHTMLRGEIELLCLEEKARRSAGEQPPQEHPPNIKAGAPPQQEGALIQQQHEPHPRPPTEAGPNAI